MASLAQVEAIATANRDAIIALQGVVNDIINNTVVIPEYVINASDPNIKVGDYCMGEVAGINGGNFFLGKVLSLPLSDDSDVEIKYRTL